MVSHDLGQICKSVGLDAGVADQGLSAKTAMASATALRAQSGASHALVVLIDLDDSANKIEFGGTINVAIADGKRALARTARMLGGRD